MRNHPQQKKENNLSNGNNGSSHYIENINLNGRLNIETGSKTVKFSMLRPKLCFMYQFYFKLKF